MLFRYVFATNILNNLCYSTEIFAVNQVNDSVILVPRQINSGFSAAGLCQALPSQSAAAEKENPGLLRGLP